MGGVTHELDLLRRASNPESDGEGLTEAEERVFETWKSIAKAVDARVVVDTVAGTSAGGLNGMLLATALGRGANLPNLREVWEESAALEQLLASPSKESLLDGKFFAKRINEVLNEIPEVGDPPEPISLFMTATALDGQARSYKDGFGGQFDVRDHRRVYRFEHDKHAIAYRKKSDGTWDFQDDLRPDFKKENNRALAQAARASAGYPVAFPPVSEQPMVAFRKRPDPIFDDPASCVIDGGVLNNAPFGPVLEAITKRRLDRPVRRVVVYVVPSEGQRAQESIAHSSCGDISFVTAALNAIQYPRETDFRTGTEDLSTRMGTSIRDTQLELFRRMNKRPKQGEEESEVVNGAKLREHVRKSAAELIDEYRLSRAGAVLWETRRRLSDARTVTDLVATPQADPEVLNEILATDPNWSPKYASSREISDPDLRNWPWGLTPAQRLCEVLSNHLHGCVRSDELNSDQKKALIDGASDVSRQLRRALAITDAVRVRLRDKHMPSVQLSDPNVSELISDVFDELQVPGRIGEIVREASTRYVEAMSQAGLGNGVLPKDVVHDFLAVEVLTGVYAPPSKIVESLTPAFEFLRLGPDKISRVFWEDRFVHLGDRKLYGIRFQHFGAFIDKEWRKSDFTWGRLDAARHLLCLLVPDGDERRRWETRLHEAILDAEAPPGMPSRAWMEGHLKALKGTDRQLIETSQGKAALRGVIESVLALLGNPPASGTSGISATAGQTWHKVLQYSRPAIARRGTGLQRGDKMWVRLLTAHVRHSAWHAYDSKELRDVPKAVRDAVRRTALGLPVLAFAVGVAVGAAIRRG